MSKATILTAARRVACKRGLYNMTRTQVAAAAKCSDALVSHHFGDMNALRGAMIDAAKLGEPAWLPVLAQALTQRDRRAVNAPAEVKRAALNTAA